MNKLPFKYDPFKSVRENALILGISESGLRKRLKKLNLSAYLNNFDSRLYQVEKVIRFFESRGERASIAKICSETCLSKSTVIKYRKILKENNGIKTNQNYVSVFRPNLNHSILSYSKNQSDILKWILNLHLKSETFDCDLTASELKFYKKIPVPQCLYDKYPISDNVKPLELAEQEKEHFQSVIADLPFIIRTPNESRSIIHQRFTSYPSSQELFQSYEYIIGLAHRILNKNGYFVMKCQNTSYSGNNIWIHPFVIETALRVGFSMIDEFVLINPSPIISVPPIHQKLARKAHSYFLVFNKL